MLYKHDFQLDKRAVPSDVYSHYLEKSKKEMSWVMGAKISENIPFEKDESSSNEYLEVYRNEVVAFSRKDWADFVHELDVASASGSINRYDLKNYIDDISKK